MALPVFSVSPLLVHPRSAQSLPWRRARGRQKTPSEKNTDTVSSLLAAYPPLANVTAEADMLLKAREASLRATEASEKKKTPKKGPARRAPAP